MASPFPGMDPYIERADWPDFHAVFLVTLRTALNRSLPEGYRAQIDERVALIEEELPPRLVKPDLSVDHARSGDFAATREGQQGTALVLEPVKIPLLSYVETVERRIEILKHPNRELVTIIELLSPWNKSPGAGHSEYLAKRLHIIRQAVNLVEFDLLLGGRRIQLSRPAPAGDYYAYISRSNERPNCDVYAWGLRDPLPPVPIPLRSLDEDLVIDLGRVFAEAFAVGGYDSDRDFRTAVPPTVPAEQKAWAGELAKSAIPG